ncbi:atherin-like [Poecilia formosa]|uniref:atherin n=1 Tax=Poecilia formosa TaxID=48698 RepID=UPI0004440A7C|nr:PREDICTED: atherin-like [Poecilia formosa]XP_007575424.1 PREDICTED: atherin-like [Poecilia formosa]
MSEPNKYREWILETIDSLRSRKARPDLERICRMVRRRHGSDPDRTRTELEKLIQEQTVLKVSYKGSISYRNAAKVQRKSRKRSEFGGGADAPRERTKPDHPNNNNGDSAHSFTDPEEGETEPDPRAETSVGSRNKKLQPASSPGSGNGCLSCGATTSCAVGSGCEEEKASAPRDKGLGQQGAGGCLPLGVSRGAGTGDRSEDVPSGGGKKPSLSGADTRSQTYCGSDSQAQTQRQTESGQPKLRLGGGSTKAAHRHANSELRELAALSEKPLRAAGGGGGCGGGSAAATRGHVKPLGLKEILGYLSSQERLSEEKLTRGKVKVVMEREVERGRLRRTRCGNITLPLRGMEPDEPEPSDSSADRLARSALQDKRAAKKSPPPARPESEPMETGEKEEEGQGGEEEEKDNDDDPRSSDEDGGLSPVAMTTEAGLAEKSGEDAGFQRELKEESPQREDGKGMCELDFPPESRSPLADGASWSECNDACSEEGAFSSDHLGYTHHNEINLTTSSFRNLEYKTEIGASSCMLTPTASPRDSSLPEERGANDSSGGHMKFGSTRVSPVDWTVSDVVSYFTAVGFPEQAAAFRTQEIDGKSLLLMQRNDVLTGLSIKLGPALKIYERHIKVLQKTHFEDNDCCEDAKNTLRLLC